MVQKVFLTIIWCLIVLANNSESGAQSSEKEREKVIVYSKQIDVSKIDPQLPHQKLSDWVIAMVGSTAKITWDVNDCGEQTGTDVDRDRDMPICVGIVAMMDDNRTVELAVAVGTERKGLTGSFGVYICIVKKEGKIFSVNELSKLHKLLEDTQ